MIKVNLIPLKKKAIPTDNIPKPIVNAVAPIAKREAESLDEIWDAVELAESPLKEVRMFQPLASDIANSLTEKIILPDHPLSNCRKDCGNAIYHGIMQAAGFVKVGKKYGGTCNLINEQQKVALRYVSDYAETRTVDVNLPSDIVESILAYYCKKEWDTSRQRTFAELLGAAVLTPSKTEVPPEKETVSSHPVTNEEKKKNPGIPVQFKLDPNHIMVEMQLSKSDADTVYVKFVDRNGRLVEIPIYIMDIGEINIEDGLDMDAVLQKFASFFGDDARIVPTGGKGMNRLYDIYRGDFVIKTAKVSAFDNEEPVELNAELLLLLYHILERYSKMQELMYLWQFPALHDDEDESEEDTEVDDDEMMRAATSFGLDDPEDEESAEENRECIEDDTEDYLSIAASRPSDDEYAGEDDETEMFAPIRRRK
jgi:hypothetical protein|nr:MAG TPA: hypothetical protein [Caudoviricetes sp.]